MHQTSDQGCRALCAAAGLMFALAFVVSGCGSTDETLGFGGTGPAGGSGGSVEGGGGGAPGGSGGSGGSTGGSGGSTGGSGGSVEGGGGAGGGDICEDDCSAIDTPQCLEAVCNDGGYPGTVGECVVIDRPTGTTCDDELFCTTDDACDEGQCVGGPQNDCGMSAPTCQDVACNEGSSSCSTVPSSDGTPCIAADLCQINATCTNGLCVGTLKDCFFSPLNECNDVACNPQTGDCEGTPDAAKDGDPCMLSGDLCMDGKTCDNGQCQGGAPKDCGHLDQGCQAGACDPVDGTCFPEAIAPGDPCPDGDDWCNEGICDNQANCIPTPLPDGTVCDDYNACTDNDECTAGDCSGSQVANCEIYFTEAFESCPPGGWSLNPDWECGVPSNVGPATTVSGTRCLGTIIDGDYNGSNEWATAVADTPPIDLSLATVPTLAFWAWVDTEGLSYDGYNLKISTDDGQSFVLLDTDTPYNLVVGGEQAWGGHQAALGWQLVTADLISYQGDEIILRFAFRTDGVVNDPGVYLDDVVVAEPDSIPLWITTASPLPSALVGESYSVPMQKQGGTGSSVWSITAGSNHSWLGIDSASGVLSGTPAGGDWGPVSVTIRVEEPGNPANFDEQVFLFDVVTSLYSQDFEGACPNGWTFVPDWECGVPSVVGPAAAYSGSQCIATQIDADYNTNQPWATTATSPEIDLGVVGSPTVQWRMWLDTEGIIYDGVNLKISIDSGQSFQLVPLVTPDYGLVVANEDCWGGNQSADGWQPFSADLSAYLGETVQLQFSFRSDNSQQRPGAYIDDVRVAY